METPFLGRKSFLGQRLDEQKKKQEEEDFLTNQLLDESNKKHQSLLAQANVIKEEKESDAGTPRKRSVKRSPIRARDNKSH